jgi:hypothetical protein
MDVDIGCKAIFDAAADQLAFHLGNQFRVGHENLLVPEERGEVRSAARVCGTVVRQFH